MPWKVFSIVKWEKDQTTGLRIENACAVLKIYSLDLRLGNLRLG